MYQGSVQVSPADRQLIAALMQPVALSDRFGRILVQNDAFTQIQTDTLHDPLRRNVADFLDAATQPGFAAFQEQIAADTVDPALRFESTVSLAGTVYALVLSPFHAESKSGLILCQLVPLTRAADARLDYLLEHFDQGIWEHDLRTGSFCVSKVWRSMRGLSDDAPILGYEDDWLNDVHPDDRDELRDAVDRQAGGDMDTIHIQYRQRHADGHWMWILCRSKIVEMTTDRRPLRIVGTDTDISEMHRRESDMRQLTNKFKMAIDVSRIGIWEYDPATNSVHWDDRLLEIYGREGEDNIRSGDSWETYIHPDDQSRAIALAEESLRNRTEFIADFRITRPDGEIRYVRSLSRFTEDQIQQDKLIGVNIDITDEYRRNLELEQARAKLEYDSNHDALTGLANRRLLDERTKTRFSNLGPADRYAVLHIDLDHFKQINDTFGHPAGDAVLIHVATELRSIIGTHGLAARTGGDEFVVFFEHAPKDVLLQGICKAIIATLRQPFIYDGQHCVLGASIGCAIGQGAPKHSNDVFVQADAALYAAKQAGRGCYCFFDSMTPIGTSAEYGARQALIDALSHDELCCYFQPQYAARGGQMVGVEALVRWECPDRGLLLPHMFMPQAESAGLTDRIDAYVFEQVIALQSQWFTQGIEYPPVAINVSRQRFESDELLDHVRARLKPHHAIVFELLETAFLDNLSDDQLDRITALRALGIGIDLDDFGSGHSSIAALQAVRPDRIKVDQSLVAPLTFRSDQLKTLQLLSQIARLEGVGIVVEGLDASDHLTAINTLDCDVLQGFALKRPMPLDAFEALLRD
ncbi:EAL domain-containing protein [Yoonia sp. BS5-3]|uniref:EAL domain-containing protein n=1 Tax=Yoonia phaeophyticola TaxID=3137369 RepID=A0ABZ2V4C4_9RHOB